MITYQGGRTIRYPRVQPIFVGSEWDAATLIVPPATMTTLVSTVPARLYLETLLMELLTGPYMDQLTAMGYGIGRGTLLPSVVDPVALSKSSTTAITEAALVARLQTLPTESPAADVVHLMIVQPDCPIKYSKSGTVGTHMVSGPYTYATVALGNFTALNRTTVWAGKIISNELTESFTDPLPGTAWCDKALNQAATGGGGEVCDFGGYQNWKAPSGNVYTIAKPRGQDGKDWSLTTPQPLITNPQNTEVQVLSTTSARVVWERTPNTLGYRIWLVLGTNWTRVTDIESVTTTSFVISGLVPGAAYKVYVESYNRLSAITRAVPLEMPTNMSQLWSVQYTCTPQPITNNFLIKWTPGWPTTYAEVHQMVAGKDVTVYSGGGSQCQCGAINGAGTFRVDVSDKTGGKATTGWFTVSLN